MLPRSPGRRHGNPHPTGSPLGPLGGAPLRGGLRPPGGADPLGPEALRRGAGHRRGVHAVEPRHHPRVRAGLRRGVDLFGPPGDPPAPHRGEPAPDPQGSRAHPPRVRHGCGGDGAGDPPGLPGHSPGTRGVQARRDLLRHLHRRFDQLRRRLRGHEPPLRGPPHRGDRGGQPGHDRLFPPALRVAVDSVASAAFPRPPPGEGRAPRRGPQPERRSPARDPIRRGPLRGALRGGVRRRRRDRCGDRCDPHRHRAGGGPGHALPRDHGPPAGGRRRRGWPS